MSYNDESAFDTEHTTFPICPHCGYAVGDAWELSDSDQIECGRCEKDFTVERHTEVTYTTRTLGATPQAPHGGK